MADLVNSLGQLTGILDLLVTDEIGGGTGVIVGVVTELGVLWN